MTAEQADDPGQQAPGRRRPAARASFSPTSNSFASRLVDGPLAEAAPDAPAATCPAAYLFGANLALALANLLLLSLISSSVLPLDDGHLDALLRDKLGAWRRQLAQFDLEQPVRLTAGSAILTNALASHRDGPLIIESHQQPATDGNHEAQLLISSASPNEEAGGLSPARNFILIRGRPRRTGGEPSPEAEPPPVEIATKSLTLSLIGRPSGHPQRPRSQLAASTGKPSRAARRLLEFDGSQRAATLYLSASNQLASPAEGAAWGSFLFVGEQLQLAHLEALGTIENNFDIQTRRGNLSCRSEGALRLVSKLGKLRLTAAEQLSLDSPAINLDAPSGLFIANGIKYLDGGTGDALGQRARDASEQRRDAEHPRAYNLLLADGRLVAAPA